MWCVFMYVPVRYTLNDDDTANKTARCARRRSVYVCLCVCARRWTFMLLRLHAPEKCQWFLMNINRSSGNDGLPAAQPSHQKSRGVLLHQHILTHMLSHTHTPSTRVLHTNFLNWSKSYSIVWIILFFLIRLYNYKKSLKLIWKKTASESLSLID